MIKRIIMGASKGGISKTSTTAGVALNLALRGKKVLLLDADPEGNLTSLMSSSYSRWNGKELSEPSTLMYALATGDLTQAVTKVMKNLYLIPSSMDFSNYPDFLLEHYYKKTSSVKDCKLKYISYLTKMMRPVEKQIKPDFVFCDIPPSSDLFEKSCLYYVGSGNDLGYLYLMMQTQQHSFQGVKYFFQFAAKLLKEYHLSYQIAGVQPVLLQRQAPSDNNVLEQAKKSYGTNMLMTPIPYRERIKRYAITGISIPHTKPRDHHDKKITKLYSRITNEILDRIKKINK